MKISFCLRGAAKQEVTIAACARLLLYAKALALARYRKYDLCVGKLWRSWSRADHASTNSARSAANEWKSYMYRDAIGAQSAGIRKQSFKWFAGDYSGQFLGQMNLCDDMKLGCGAGCPLDHILYEDE